MSRCFPYTRSGHCKNGAAYEALIESIKLQKETDKTKAERKKEKRAKKEKKEKKRKERRNSEDELKLPKNTNGDCFKVLQKAAEFTEAQINGTHERSAVTEECGPSIGSQQPSHSSESTQNSNKRKRDDDGVLPDCSTFYGKSIKIRLLKKHQESDCSSFGADAITNILLSMPSSNLDGSLVSSIRNNGFWATSGRENRTHLKSSSISEVTKIGDLNRVRFGKIQSALSSAKPSFQSTRPQLPSVSSSGSQVHHQSQLENKTRSTFVLSHINEPKHCYPQINMVSNKMNTTNGAGAPMNVSLSQKQLLKEDLQKEVLSRSANKKMKRHTKYETLIGSWLPPVLESHLLDAGVNEDWLCRSNVSSSSVTKGEVETCWLSVASWQPCARFLAEVDMHALPYTVPY